MLVGGGEPSFLTSVSLEVEETVASAIPGADSASSYPDMEEPVLTVGVGQESRVTDEQSPLSTQAGVSYCDSVGGGPSFPFELGSYPSVAPVQSKFSLPHVGSTVVSSGNAGTSKPLIRKPRLANQSLSVQVKAVPELVLPPAQSKSVVRPSLSEPPSSSNPPVLLAVNESAVPRTKRKNRPGKKERERLALARQRAAAHQDLETGSV